MAVTSVKTNLVSESSTGLKTGLIWRAKNAAGNLVDSNEQVLVADESTKSLGKATTGTSGDERLFPVAANSRYDNTGI